MTVTAEDLDAAASSVAGALRKATAQDWRATAGTGDWDSWHTAEHLGDCLLSYAAQLVAQPTDGFVRFAAAAEKDATPAEVLEFALTGAAILAATIKTATPSARAFHPAGIADPEGFAAMGCVELLVHGADMARGLDEEIDPPGDLCERLLARLFPEVGLEDEDPWTVLLWATGRTELPGRGRRDEWRWHAGPLS